MANQYNPSFNHPSFIVADYGTEFGAGVNYCPEQLTFNAESPNRVRSYKHRIFNSYAKFTFRWNDVGVTMSGTAPHTMGFCNTRATWPYEDFVWAQITINTNPPQRRFCVSIIADQGVYSPLTDWIPIVGGTTGDFIVEVWAGPDLGAGNCDLTWRIRNSTYSLDLNHSAFGYVPRTVINEWFAEFYGLSSDWGQTILSGNLLAASQYFLSSSIPSVGAFGSPSIFISEPVAQGVSVYGIGSGEIWGSPSILVSQSYIFPNSISSAEAFGAPALISRLYIFPNSISSAEALGAPAVVITTTVVSSLPPPSPAKEGDIRITFGQYDQFVDFILADRDVDRDAGLETAVLITLLTDKHADADDPLPDDSGYHGGWFGDSLPVVPDYKMGTKLWLLQRAKTVAEIPAIAKEYLADGFKWMVEDGIVQTVDVTVERRRDLKATLAFTISFTKPEGTTIFYSFYYNWEAQLLRRQ